MIFTGFNEFSNNRATLGGASYYASSLVEFKHFQTFELNVADQGGAIALNDNSKLKLNEPLQADFINNGAMNYGGANFFEDVLTMSKCTALSNA